MPPLPLCCELWHKRVDEIDRGVMFGTKAEQIFNVFYGISI